MTDVVVTTTTEGRILTCNPAVQTLLGYSPGELVGQSVSALVGGGDREGHAGHMQHYLRTGESRIIGRPRRLLARHRDGSDVPITLSLTETSVEGQRIFAGVMRDARMEVERERVLERQNYELETQLTVNEVLQRSREVPALLDGVLRALLALPDLEVEHKAGVFLLEAAPAARLPIVGRGERRLRLQHTVGEFSEDFQRRENTIDVGACLCGRAARDGRVLVSAECFEDPRHEHRFGGMRAHGHYIVPIRTDGEVRGVMFFYTQPRPLADERRIALLETIGTQVGLGLARLEAEDEVRRSRDAMRYLAHHDALTGVRTRGSVLDAFARGRREALAEGRAISVVMVDLDHFKQINDRLGHLAGDAVLKEAARRFADAVRPHDTVGRYGGEEFLVVLPDCGLEEARTIAERLRAALTATPVEHEGHAISVTASFGVAACCAGSAEHRTIARADEALYQAKHAGRDRVEIAEPTPARRAG